MWFFSEDSFSLKNNDRPRVRRMPSRRISRLVRTTAMEEEMLSHTIITGKGPLTKDIEGIRNDMVKACADFVGSWAPTICRCNFGFARN